MDLNEFSQNLIRDQVVRSLQNGPGDIYSINPSTFRSISKTEAFNRLFYYVGNEGKTRSILSAIFWNILLSSDLYYEVLNKLEISDPVLEGGRAILTMQPDFLGDHRFDLLLLTPVHKYKWDSVLYLRDILYINRGISEFQGYFNDHFSVFWSLISQQINLIDRADLKGPGKEKRRVDDSNLKDYLKVLLNPEIIFQLFLVDFRILVARMPETVLQSGLPTSACGIALGKGQNALSSVGVVARNANGKLGVTGALHGMHQDPTELFRQYRQKGASCIIGKEVYVDGHKGKILDADEITDSCFIELEEANIPSYVSTLGPMSSRPPFRTEGVHFEGITSAKVSTNVTEVDVGIPGVSFGRQRCVYTKPVTNRGDSGSALINDQNELVGFAFKRTGYGEIIEFSEWIWADSVFDALQITQP